jgi:mRNA-degrading endonuclease YafQ of YafQ-DinJ toxin-antitoxin module
LNNIQILMTSSFKKSYKKMYKNQQDEVKKVIKEITMDPGLGEEKKDDLKGIFVHKFQIGQQLTLLAYQFDPKTRILLMLGSHQSFYKNLKRVIS